MATVSLYSNFDNFQGKSLKRKWEEDESDVRSSPDQCVPQFNSEKKLKTEFPFSNLMRSMAAKYQPQPAAPAPVYNPLIMSMFSPVNNPYSRLMAAMADMSQPKPSSPVHRPVSPASSSSTPTPPPQVSTSQPLDLSKPIEKEIDVVSTDDEDDNSTSVENDHKTSVDQWSPRQVSKFIKNIDGCEDFGLIFESEKISGSKLMSLSVHHLVQLLGIPLGQAIRIVSTVRRADPWKISKESS